MTYLRESTTGHQRLIVDDHRQGLPSLLHQPVRMLQRRAETKTQAVVLRCPWPHKVTAGIERLHHYDILA